MINSFRTDDPLARQAIWEAYNRRCYYSEVNIKISEMHLDHVIPLHLCKKPVELSKVLQHFNLPTDFNIRSILNIVPCLPKENIKKGSIPLPNTTVILNDIKKKLKKIESRYAELLKEDISAKSLSLYKKAIKTNNTKSEELHDYLMDSKPTYDEIESYIEDLRYAHYSCSTKRVFLNGFLPRPDLELASCCISFKSLALRGLLFTMTERDVLKLNKPEHKQYTLEKKPDAKHSPELKDTAFFNYNGVNFFLEIEEINQFYDLIRRYSEKIELHRKLVKEYYGGKNFQYSDSIDGYRLGKIKRSLWSLMIDFAKKFDFERGKSEWHIFDASDHMFMVTTRGECSRFNHGFHTMLVPEQITDHSFQDFRYADNEMWIVWRKMEPYVRDQAEDYSNKDRWNAYMTHEWLVNEYIPYLIWYYEVKKKDKIIVYRNSFERFKKTFEVSKYLWE